MLYIYRLILAGADRIVYVAVMSNTNFFSL